MATVRIKSAEIVRKFAEIKALIRETGNRVVVEEYNKPVLVIYPADEHGEPMKSKTVSEAAEVDRLKNKLHTKQIKISQVSFD